MARYKFSWDNLPPGLLRGLKRELALDGDASIALRKAYGARPSVDFVQDTWAVLLQSWLTKDRESRVRIVEELRSRRLGDHSIQPRNSSDQVAYLKSCRNSAALREVVIAVLIAVGEPPTGPQAPTAAPRERSGSWQQFVTSLAASLSALEEDQYLIIQRKDRPWFVQFSAQGPHGLRSELVSNSYLEAGQQLPKKAISAALKLGWIPPTGSPAASTPENDPDGSPNYYREWEQPVAYIAASRLAVDTLVDVLAVPHPGYLEYTAFASEGSKILLPTLGLKIRREQPTEQPAAPAPVDGKAIATRLLLLLRQVSGNDDLAVDADGEIPLQYGSSMVFVRVFGDPPVVRVFSPVLGDVRPSGELSKAIRDLNLQYAFIKFVESDGTVIAWIDMFGDPLVEQHVLHACGVVGETANTLDDQLQERFGGKTFFGEYAHPKLPQSHSGYL